MEKTFVLDGKEIRFVPDQWIKVQTDSKESALRFFGAPEGWPVKFVGFSKDPEKPGRIFAVLADGLNL